MIANPPGNPVMPLRAIRLGDKVCRQRMPGVIACVDMRAKPIREFRRFCEHHNVALAVRDSGELLVCERGMDWTAVQSVCTDGAYECIASPEVLDRLTLQTCLLSWHEPVSCSVHFSGAGNGAEKIKTRPKCKDPEPSVLTKLHNDYREALRCGKLNLAAALLTKLGRTSVV